MGFGSVLCWQTWQNHDSFQCFTVLYRLASIHVLFKIKSIWATQSECLLPRGKLPIVGARRNSAPLDMEVSSASVINGDHGDLAANSGQIIRLLAVCTRFYALLCSIQLHFAANRKQLMLSYPVWVSWNYV